MFVFPNWTVGSFKQIFINPTSSMAITKLTDSILYDRPLNWIISFLEDSKYLIYCQILSQYFWGFWQMQNTWFVIDQCAETRAHGINIRLTAECWIQFCMQLTKTIWVNNYCISLLTNNWLLRLLRHFYPVSHRMSKFVNLRTNCPTSCFSKSCFSGIITIAN